MVCKLILHMNIVNNTIICEIIILQYLFNGSRAPTQCAAYICIFMHGYICYIIGDTCAYTAAQE